MTKIAIIRIRGTDDVNKSIVDTMKMLKLLNKNLACHARIGDTIFDWVSPFLFGNVKYFSYIRILKW